MPVKPVLFLLPGLMCDEAVWVNQQQVLSPHAEVIIPVFRGFDSLVNMANHVLELAPERFSIVGHSMGGRVAWEIMELAGNRIDKFVVMDSGVHPVTGDESESRQVLIDLALSDGLQAVADNWIKPMVHPGRHKDTELLNTINDMILRNSVEDFLGQIQALLNRKDQRDNLLKIKQKVLLITGEVDTLSPPEQNQRMANRINRADLGIVTNAGHMVTMEKPQEVSTILLNWFAAYEK